MVGLGSAEILILLLCAGFFFGSPLLVALLFFLAQRSRQAATASNPPLPPSPAPAPPAQSPFAFDSHAEVVARLTQRFCPQCRSPLSTDSPEGLCPACLMAGAMGGDMAADPANGMAATTPPSGSKPPLDGAALAEIGDLQQHFPQLEILELLGRGGMGAVYKARQKNLDRIVALKVIPPEAAKDPTFAERFGREARALARLNHPNIVTVYDFGEIGALHYLLMEYVDGVNLRQTLRAGRLAPREAVAIVPPICDALQYAHDQGVVHRDIKPENVLLDRSGRVKIADFGLAKLLGKGPDDFTLTRTQQVMGTPRYMAPEQIERPSTVDHRADIYSLGVVIYEMLTGELPIGRFEPPSHKVQVDVRIDQVVLRSLEKDPQRRYQRASEVKTDLASATSWPTLAASALPSPLAGEGPGVRGNNGQSARPSWHTPAHAIKSDVPGGVPLAHVLMVAFGMVLGVLLMGGGLAALLYGFYYTLKGASSAGAAWGIFGAGFGCLVGGAGSTIGSYNTYRQMAGAEDLLKTSRTTWFDWIMRGYLVFGLALLTAGIFLVNPVYSEGTGIALLLLGGIATFQALLFLVMRTLYVLGANPAATETPRDSARGLLKAPGLGLLVAGIVTIAVAVVAIGAACLIFFDSVRVNPSEGSLLGMSMTNLVFALPVGILLILGGLSMRRASSYSLAMVACFAGLFPHGFAWPITLPLAIWGLVTLGDRRAGRAFDAQPGEPASPAAEAELRRAAVLRRVFAPALALIIGGVLFPLPNLVLMFLYFNPKEFEPYFRGQFAPLAAALVLSLMAASVMVLGGFKLRSLDTFNLARMGAIAAFVPASPLWPISLPIGLWALAVMLRQDVRAWFDVPEGDVPAPQPPGDALALPAKALSPRDTSTGAIRHRVAGPAIGLMIVGAIGLLPCAAMVLTVPALVVVPSRTMQQGPSIERIDLPGSPVLVPGGAVLPPTSISLLPSALLAQSEVMEPLDALARGPLWGVVFAGAVILLSLPPSLVMIIGGWRMRQLKSYGLATIASVLAMLPCTFAWMLGLPLGLWSLIVLLQPEVREAFES